MGGVMIPMMKNEGYSADYAVNVTTHASLAGALMPTSHNMIIYSLAAGGHVSIGDLMFAGLLPAIVLTICMLVAAYWVAVRPATRADTWHGWRAVASSLRALPGMFVVVIILWGILPGIFTATESAGIAVTYSILTLLGYRTMTWATC